MHVRRGRLSRSDAINICKIYDGRFPSTYLGVPIAEILDEIDMDHEEFVKICDRFTNKKLFSKNNTGELAKDRDGTLIKVNYDNVPADAPR